MSRFKKRSKTNFQNCHPKKLLKGLLMTNRGFFEYEQHSLQASIEFSKKLL